MTAPGKTDETETRALTVRWPADHFEKIEEAARVLSERERYTVTPTDIIRSGAVLRAEEILGAA